MCLLCGCRCLFSINHFRKKKVGSFSNKLLFFAKRRSMVHVCALTLHSFVAPPPEHPALAGDGGWDPALKTELRCARAKLSASRRPTRLCAQVAQNLSPFCPTKWNGDLNGRGNMRRVTEVIVTLQL